MTARGLAFLYGDERQCGECQNADPAILRGASDRCERGIDDEAAGPANLPATKLKAPWTRLNRAEFGRPCARKQIRSAPSARWRTDRTRCRR